MSTYTGVNKSSASFTGVNKSSASWNAESKSTGGYQYLLIEDGSFLLQETLSKIILEQSSVGGLTWTGINKS